MGFGDYDFGGSLDYGSGLDSIAETYLSDLPNAYESAVPSGPQSWMPGEQVDPYAFDNPGTLLDPNMRAAQGMSDPNASDSSSWFSGIGGLAGLSRFGLNALAAVSPLATALLNRKSSKTGPEFPRLSGHASPFYSFQQAGPKPLSLAGSIPATQHDPLAEYLKLVQGLRG